MSSEMQRPARSEEVEIEHLHGETQLSSWMPQHPVRPAYGTQGTPISLRANFFELKYDADLLLFRYSVKISLVLGEQKTACISKVTSRALISLLLRMYFAEQIHELATDGWQTIISRKEQPLRESPYCIRYQEHRYELVLRQIGTLPLSRLFNKDPQPIREEYLQALSIVLSHRPKFSPHIMSAGPDSYFDLDSTRVSLGAGLHAMRGLFVSVRLAEGRLLVNTYPKYTICYDDMPLDQVIHDYLRENGSSSMMKLAGFLRGLKVQLTHLGMQQRTGKMLPRIKTITGLASPKDGRDLTHPPVVPCFAAGAKEVKFFWEHPSHRVESVSIEGTRSNKRQRSVLEDYTSVWDYFKNAHGITIRDQWLPIVNVGSLSKPLYLPAQVCRVVSNQSYRMPLSTIQRQGILRLANKNASHDQQALARKEISSMLGFNAATEGPTPSSFGLDLRSEAISVPGRILPPPSLEYRDRKTIHVRLGSWNLQQVKFTTRTKVSKWTYLWLTQKSIRDISRRDWELLDVSLGRFHQKLKALGVEAPQPHRPGLHVELTGSAPMAGENEARLARALDRFVELSAGRSDTLLLIIFPWYDESIYNRVKFLCDITRGIPNACVVLNKFLHANDHFWSNMALKINLKLGGRNQSLPGLSSGIINHGSTMVVGVDVTHPTSGNDSSRMPSVAAMVASVDRFLGQWPAAMCIQPARQEMVTCMDTLISSRLRVWQKENGGRLPANILVYRDGVSETQYRSVLEVELPLIRKACDELYRRKDNPRISIVIVGKRHHTRFHRAPDHTRSLYGGSNTSCHPQNGTVVDRGVTDSQTWEFYLQSHTAIRGVPRPAHYVVIFDEIFRSYCSEQPQSSSRNPADALETLTHNMCYLSGRATKASSICPPVLYADLACSRARCYLNVELDQLLSKTSLCKEVSNENQVNKIELHRNTEDTMFYL